MTWSDSGHSSRILPHLPRNIFPALPAPVHLEAQVDASGEKVDDNDDDAWDQSMAVDGVPVLGEASNAAEVFRTNAGHLQGHVQQAQRNRDAALGRTQHEDDGVMRVMIGPMAGVSEHQTPQTMVEIERFTSIRLGEYQCATDARCTETKATSTRYISSRQARFRTECGRPSLGFGLVSAAR